MIGEGFREQFTAHDLRTTAIALLLDYGRKEQAISAKRGLRNPILFSLCEQRRVSRHANENLICSVKNGRNASQINIRRSEIIDGHKIDRLQSQLRNSCVNA